MDKIFESCKIRNLRSDTIVFKTENDEFNDLHEYITTDYIRRSLYVRDMIIARNEKPVLQVENTANTVRISFSKDAYLYRNNDHTEGSLANNITCLINGNEIAVLDEMIEETIAQKEWTITFNTDITISTLTFTCGANTFFNEYQNGNEETTHTVP